MKEKKKTGIFLTHANQGCGTEPFGRCRNMQGHGQTSRKRFGGILPVRASQQQLLLEYVV